LFPYLLYVGNRGAGNIRCLSDMPVCHIDEELAWRLDFYLSSLQQREFEVRDLCGKHHKIEVWSDYLYNKVCDALRVYIFSGRRFAYLALRPSPGMSSMSLALQHLQTLERYAQEIGVGCEVLRSRTVNGNRRKNWFGMRDRDVVGICYAKLFILDAVKQALKKIRNGDHDSLCCVDRALK